MENGEEGGWPEGKARWDVVAVCRSHLNISPGIPFATKYLGCAVFVFFNVVGE